MANAVPPPRADEVGRTDVLLAIGCGLIALANYAATACPTVGPGDSGELTLAALTLGVAHPPGYPLFTWLGRIACLIPASDPARSTNLLSSITVAGAVVFIYLAARALRSGRLGATVAALLLAFSPAVWPSATNHEVYGLGLLFLAILLLLAATCSAERPRPFLLAAFVLGLATSHQPTALLWLPALAMMVVRRNDAPAVYVVLVFVLFVAGLSTSLGTLILARTDPVINWGDPASLHRFWEHVTAAQYHGLALHAPIGVFWHRLSSLSVWLDRATGHAGWILALLGALRLANTSRRALWAVLLLVATALFGITYDIPDFRVHLLPALLGVALLAGAGAHWVEERVGLLWPVDGRDPGVRTPAPVRAALRTAVEAVAVAALLAVPGHMLFTNARRNGDGRTTLVRDLGANLLASFPRDAVFIYGGDISGNAVRYLQVTRSVRPDVLPVSAEMLFSATYHDWLARRLALPSFDAMLRAAGAGTRVQRRESLVAQVVTAAAGHRPVCLGTELMTPDFFAGPVPREWRIVPMGIVNRLAPLSAPVDSAQIAGGNRELWDSFNLISAFRAYASDDLRGIQIIYASSRNNLGMLCLQQGWSASARANLRAALEYPASAEFRGLVEQNLARIKAGAD
jgi:hypothetical protein